MTSRLNLQAGDIHIWMTKPEDIRDAYLLDQYRSLLTPDELARQQRYRFEKDQHDALITRAFTRTLLSEYADTRPIDWRFEKGEKDKPEIINPPIPLRFNLSHTRGLIVCAVTQEHNIGIDVEFIARDNDILGIADRYFSPTETEELFSLPAEQQRSRFFDYWTLKESYIKAWGLGLAIPLDDFSFHIGEADDEYMNHNIKLSFAPHRVDYPEQWQSWLFYPDEAYRMALSINSHQQNLHKLSCFYSTPLLGFHSINMPPRL